MVIKKPHRNQEGFEQKPSLTWEKVPSIFVLCTWQLIWMIAECICKYPNWPLGQFLSPMNVSYLWALFWCWWVSASISLTSHCSEQRNLVLRSWNHSASYWCREQNTQSWDYCSGKKLVPQRCHCALLLMFSDIFNLGSSLWRAADLPLIFHLSSFCVTNEVFK